MASEPNTPDVAAIAMALSAQATAHAKCQTTNVKVFADKLAELMAEIHGGEWRAVIDHGANTSFVLIRPCNEKPIHKPNRAEPV